MIRTPLVSLVRDIFVALQGSELQDDQTLMAVALQEMQQMNSGAVVSAFGVAAA